MKMYYYLVRAYMHRMYNRYFKYIIHPTRLKRDLVLRRAVDEARRQFDVYGVRHFVVPTPEGQLRVISSADARTMIRNGFFPRKWKIQNIYSIAFFWTAATKAPKHGNSLESFANMQLYAEWWANTHK